MAPKKVLPTRKRARDGEEKEGRAKPSKSRKIAERSSNSPKRVTTTCLQEAITAEREERFKHAEETAQRLAKSTGMRKRTSLKGNERGLKSSATTSTGRKLAGRNANRASMKKEHKQDQSSQTDEKVSNTMDTASRGRKRNRAVRTPSKSDATGKDEPGKLAKRRKEDTSNDKGTNSSPESAQKTPNETKQGSKVSRTPPSVQAAINSELAKMAQRVDQVAQSLETRRNSGKRSDNTHEEGTQTETVLSSSSGSSKKHSTRETKPSTTPVTPTRQRKSKTSRCTPSSVEKAKEEESAIVRERTEEASNHLRTARKK